MLRVFQIALLPQKDKLLQAQQVKKLAAEFPGKDFNGDEELFAGTDPRACAGQAACRDYAVDVGMKRQVLAPRMQDRCETERCAEKLLI